MRLLIRATINSKIGESLTPSLRWVSQDAIAPFLNPVINAITTGQDVSSVNFEELLTGENLGALLGALTGAQLSHLHGYHEIHVSAVGFGVYRPDVNRVAVGLEHHHRPLGCGRRNAHR